MNFTEPERKCCKICTKRRTLLMRGKALAVSLLTAAIISLSIHFLYRYFVKIDFKLSFPYRYL